MKIRSSKINFPCIGYGKNYVLISSNQQTDIIINGYLRSMMIAYPKEVVKLIELWFNNDYLTIIRKIEHWTIPLYKILEGIKYKIRRPDFLYSICIKIYSELKFILLIYTNLHC